MVLSRGQAVFLAPNVNLNTMNAFNLLLAIRDRHQLEDFVVAIPSGSLEREANLPLIRLPFASGDKLLPRLATPKGDDVRLEDNLNPYFASTYYDHAKKR